MEPYLRLNFGGDRSGERWGMQAIVDAIAQQIAVDRSVHRSLQGCRLPPIRVLAHQLGVSKNTVSAAYEELCAQTLVESRGRAGLFVASDSVPRAKGEPATGSQVPLPVFKPLIRVSTPSLGGEGMTALSTVFIDPRLLPKDQVSACFRSVLKTPGLANFADRQGFLPLRRKIAQRLRKRGIDAEPDQIVTTVGSQQVLDLVCRSLQTKSVATENPAYYVGRALFEMNGISPVGLPIDPFRGIDAKVWEKQIARHRPSLAYLTTNFQNPTGYSYSSVELKQIIEWSHRYSFGILEDDWGSDMLSYSEFRPSLRTLGGSNVLYMNSFTKKLLPSLRIGYVVGNDRTVPALVQAKRLSVSGVPTIIEAALFEFLDRGYYDAHLKTIQYELDNRYQNCLECLRESMPEEVRWTSPGGGPVLWLELPDRVDLSRLTERLKEKKLLIHPSQDAFLDEPHLHGFKIGYAFLSTKEMVAAIAILSDELRRELKRS